MDTILLYVFFNVGFFVFFSRAKHWFLGAETLRMPQSILYLLWNKNIKDTWFVGQQLYLHLTSWSYPKKLKNFLSMNPYLCRSYMYAVPRTVVTKALPTAQRGPFQLHCKHLTFGMYRLVQGFSMPCFYWGSKPEGGKPTKHFEVISFLKDMEYGQSAWKYLAFFHFGFFILISSFSSFFYHSLYLLGHQKSRR